MARKRGRGMAACWYGIARTAVIDRAAAWAEIDKQVTAKAPAIPWIWDKTPLIQSENVNGVASVSNAQWELAWTSLK